MLTIERKKYLQRIAEARQTKKIILLTGLHGAGKASLLLATSRMLKDEKPPIRIVHTGPEAGVSTRKELLSSAHALGSGPSALVMNNADMISELPEALAEIIAKYSVTVFISGRNTTRLESSLARVFSSGKTSQLATIRINPLTYLEFLETTTLTDSRDSLELYCRTGGLPQSMMIDPKAPNIHEFALLRANSFILTEIIEAHAIRNPTHVRKHLSIVARSAGEILSARQVCLAFGAERITISPQAVLDYFAHCAESGILVPVPVLDLDKKKNIDAGSVWYFGDTGLHSAFVRQEGLAELARAEENLAFLRLADDGWAISHGRIGYNRQLKEDISFVCERNGQRAYLQIIPNTATSGERLRKRAALLAIRDAWPRYLIDADSEEDGADGIRRLCIRELLIDGIVDYGRLKP